MAKMSKAVNKLGQAVPGTKKSKSSPAKAQLQGKAGGKKTVMEKIKNAKVQNKVNQALQKLSKGASPAKPAKKPVAAIKAATVKNSRLTPLVLVKGATSGKGKKATSMILTKPAAKQLLNQMTNKQVGTTPQKNKKNANAAKPVTGKKNKQQQQQGGEKKSKQQAKKQANASAPAQQAQQNKAERGKKDKAAGSAAALTGAQKQPSKKKAIPAKQKKIDKKGKQTPTEQVGARKEIQAKSEAKRKESREELLKRKRSGSGEKKVQVSQTDMDRDMDEYWFKAGKGPNPKLKDLDGEMDSYWKAKKEAESAKQESEAAASAQ